jgi:hypothetical protein
MSVVLLACGATPPSPVPTGSGEAGQASAPPIAAADCAVQQAPGPADGPPANNDEMDTSDDGPGRWHLCLNAPTTVSIEGSAWCRWNADRTSVGEVTGLPVTSGAVDYDAWLSFPAAAFELHLTDRGHDGVIANYAPAAGLPLISTDAGQVHGGLPVDVVLVADEGVAPPGAPAQIAGQLAWACGNPPAA